MESVAYDYKYTDRDVRENPELRTLVREYLENYGGDFEPLREAQLVLRHGRRILSTAEVRKVLNCMRHDWNAAATMPAPISWKERRREEKGAVVQMDDRPKVCSDEALHHHHKTEECAYGRCIGRTSSRSVVGYGRITAVKRKFIVSRTGSLIHRVDPNAEHAFNFEPDMYDESAWLDSTRMHIRTMCKYPRVITNGYLFDKLTELVGYGYSFKHPLNWCPRCVEEEWDSLG